MTEFTFRIRFWRDHRWAPGQMSAYLDEELGSAQRARMDRHTRECPECDRLLAGLRGMLDRLHRSPAPSGNPGARLITASVLARLDDRDNPSG
jgi:anti-sigma factor RsiW